MLLISFSLISEMLLVNQHSDKFGYSYLLRPTAKAIQAKNKIAASMNQNIHVNAEPSSGTTSVAVIIPITMHSPPMAPKVQANAPIIEPPLIYHPSSLCS